MTVEQRLNEIRGRSERSQERRYAGGLGGTWYETDVPWLLEQLDEQTELARAWWGQKQARIEVLEGALNDLIAQLTDEGAMAVISLVNARQVLAGERP